MADFMEPTIAEDYTTLTGTATWALTNDNGYTNNNTAVAGGSISLVNAGLAGVCTFPLFIPPTFTAWLTSAETVTGAADVEISTPYQPTYQDLPANMATISERGDQATLRCNLAAGANSLDALVITYSMSFSTADDLDYFSRIDNESTTDYNITTADKRRAIRYANAKILYLLKDWARFYSARLDVQVRKLLIQAESYYALDTIFDIKSKQYLNVEDRDRFSVGDLSVDPALGDKKEFAIMYANLSTLYRDKADAIMGIILPPGTDSVRSTFYFDTCKSIKTAEDDEIEDLTV